MVLKKQKWQWNGKLLCIIWLTWITCKISDFCHSAVDVFSLQGCYVAYVNSWLLTFWDNTLLPSSGVKEPRAKHKKTLWKLQPQGLDTKYLKNQQYFNIRWRPALAGVYAWCRKWILSSLKNFSLPEIGRRSWQNFLPFHNTLLDFATLTNTSWVTWEIPLNYVITNVGWKSIVMKTEGNEKM